SVRSASQVPSRYRKNSASSVMINSMMRFRTSPPSERVQDVALRVRPLLNRGAEQGDGSRVEFVGGIGLVVLEPCRELVCVLEDLVNCAGHRHHLRYLSLAGMAWTITIATSPSTYPTSRMRAARMGPIIMVNPSPRAHLRTGFLYACRMSSRLKPCL
ncbi:MAG: hypothetical protein REI45_01730, partial [Propionicimonas sp.]|nr:hypothetical protein [Propionicimonas sp.]